MDVGPSEADQKNIHGSLPWEGRERTFMVHLPELYDPLKRYPLVFVLHGGGGNAANAARMSEMSALADKEKFIVVYPNGTGRGNRFFTWNAWTCCDYAFLNHVDDTGFIRALISKIESEYAIDCGRIFACGFSNGGMMAHRLGAELADRFAAIASVGGSLNADKPEPAAPVSVLIIHGTMDRHVLYEGGAPEQRVAGNMRIDHPVAHAVSFWSRHNRCGEIKRRRLHEQVVEEIHTGGPSGASVKLLTIEGGGHSWPGGRKGLYFGNADEPFRDLSATAEIWNFFSAQPRKAISKS